MKKYSKYLKTPNNKKEFHIPGYNYCGPGTDVEGRLKRGDYGINDLDNACRIHDVEYMIYDGDNKKLQESDNRLVEASKNIIDEMEKNLSIVSKIVNILSSKGIPIGFASGVINLISDPAKSGQKFAAEIVKNVFENKEKLERILGFVGYKDFPSHFAGGLNKKSHEETVKEGRELYNKYIK